MFLGLVENISELDNKVRYTPQEETHMNRKVMVNIITEIILLTVIQSTVIMCNIYLISSEPCYIIIIQTVISVSDICNALICFQFISLIFMVKQRYSHINKRLANWINGTVSRPIYLNKQNEKSSQSDRAVDSVITTSCVSSVADIGGTLKQADIHTLRQIYSELYDITCLINDIYGIPILATTCWMLTGVLVCVYGTLIHFNERAVENVARSRAFMVLFFKVTFFFTQLRTKQGIQEF
jgi:hypothetical protein